MSLQRNFLRLPLVGLILAVGTSCSAADLLGVPSSQSWVVIDNQNNLAAQSAAQQTAMVQSNLAQSASAAQLAAQQEAAQRTTQAAADAQARAEIAARQANLAAQAASQRSAERALERARDADTVVTPIPSDAASRSPDGA